MVAQRTLDYQLKRLKLHFRIFGRSEVKELRKLLRPEEIIHDCVRGYYQGGAALLVATNERVLLIDKRPLYLNLEELAYNRIKDVQFVPKFLQGTMHIRAGHKVISFRTVRDARLKRICEYINENKIDNPELEQVFKAVRKQFKPYQQPGWTPHHTAFIKRRVSKF